MLTLTALMTIWGIISYFRIKKVSNGSFNPFNGGYIDFMGIILGGTMSLILIANLMIKFLP
jgi:hypothetical protein